MELLKWISVSDRYTKMYLDRRLAPIGLNSSQHMYIIKVCQSPGITQDSFLKFFHIHPSNITRSMIYLQKKGFIRKEINKNDKRTSRLYPTQKALDAYAYIMETADCWHERILDGFSENERRLFTDFLKRAGNNAVLAMQHEIENGNSEDYNP